MDFWIAGLLSFNTPVGNRCPVVRSKWALGLAGPPTHYAPIAPPPYTTEPGHDLGPKRLLVKLANNQERHCHRHRQGMPNLQLRRVSLLGPGNSRYSVASTISGFLPWSAP